MKLVIFTAEPSNFVPVKIKEEAEKAGVEAKILDVSRALLLETEMPGIYEVNQETQELEQIEVNQDTVVIPRLNEYHLEIKLSMLKRMELSGASLINTPESMELCNDKLMSQVILSSLGITVPETFTLHHIEDLEKGINFFEKHGTLKYPVIIKTLRGTHGIGVMKVDSRASLMSVAQTLLKEKIEFLIQEYIEHEHSLRMIMLGENLLAANHRGQPKEKKEFRTNAHLGSETKAYEPGPEELEIGKKIVKHFGCQFCAIDYIMVDGKIVVLEVNGSPGLENIQKNWPDRNLPAEVVKFCQSVSKGEGDAEPETAEVVTQVDAPKQGDQESVVQKVEPGKEEAPKREPSDETPAEVSTSEVPQTQDKSPEAKPEDQGNFLQEVELVTVHRITENPVEARIDTGAKFCSLSGSDIQILDDFAKFTYGESTYKVPLVGTVKIKNVHGGDSSVRPLVKLDLTVRDQRLNGIEFTINDRSKMKYTVLIGRNALQHLKYNIRVHAGDAELSDDESEVKRINAEEE